MVNTFDPKQLKIFFDGVRIEGYPDGSFLSVAWDKDSYIKVTGADGLTQRVKSNDYAATITVTILQTSASNDLLSTFWNADRLANSGSFSVAIYDAEGRTALVATNGWVQKASDVTYSNGSEVRAWTIATDALVGNIGGNF